MIIWTLCVLVSFQILMSVPAVHDDMDIMCYCVVSDIDECASRPCLKET